MAAERRRAKAMDRRALRQLDRAGSNSTGADSIINMIFLWFPYWLSYGFPMASQWFPYGFPMASLWFSLWFSYGFPMVFPMVMLWVFTEVKRNHFLYMVRARFL